MARDYRLYLDDIIEAVRRIKEFTNDMDFEDFKADIKTQDAVVRNLEIIGEASGRLPEKIRLSAPEIEWRKIVGIRNILAHEYFGISLPIIWDIVQNKLNEFSNTCSRLLSESPDRPKD
jgi:uncharacterized protein with HEPN domain